MHVALAALGVLLLFVADYKLRALCSSAEVRWTAPRHIASHPFNK